MGCVEWAKIGMLREQESVSSESQKEQGLFLKRARCGTSFASSFLGFSSVCGVSDDYQDDGTLSNGCGKCAIGSSKKK